MKKMFDLAIAFSVLGASVSAFANEVEGGFPPDADVYCSTISFNDVTGVSNTVAEVETTYSTFFEGVGVEIVSADNLYYTQFGRTSISGGTNESRTHISLDMNFTIFQDTFPEEFFKWVVANGPIPKNPRKIKRLGARPSVGVIVHFFDFENPIQVGGLPVTAAFTECLVGTKEQLIEDGVIVEGIENFRKRMAQLKNR